MIELAHTFHWKVAHFRTAMNARGIYMTPVGADGAGWPDLVLVHPGTGRVIFRELKSEKGRVTSGQEAWGVWLSRCDLDWDVWRPSDMNTIAIELSNGRARTTNTPHKEKL